MILLNSLFILFSLYFQIPILASNFIWIFNFWFYLIGFALQLTVIYISFTEPGTFMVFENELRNAFEGTNREDTLEAILNLIFFGLLIFVGLSNVLIAYTLYIGTYYYIKFGLLSEENN